MKRTHWLIAAAALAPLAMPVAAQHASSGIEFVEAVRTSNGDKVVELLTAKPTGLIDARGDDGNTALIVALARRDEEWTGFLLGKGADTNLTGKGGDTPLMAAARAGYFDGVGWLIQLGAKVDSTNRSGETALILAVQQRQPMIVKILLSAGADPDKTDSVAGYSARNYAARDPRAGEIAKLIESKKPKPAG